MVSACRAPVLHQAWDRVVVSASLDIKAALAAACAQLVTNNVRALVRLPSLALKVCVNGL